MRSYSSRCDGEGGGGKVSSTLQYIRALLLLRSNLGFVSEPTAGIEKNFLLRPQKCGSGGSWEVDAHVV